MTTSGYIYDLLILIGAPDLESCGDLYREHPNLFFGTPIINIDHTPENERYGQMNVVDLTACACGEVCHDLMETIDPKLVDAQAATAFLTGMIAKTKSFKSQNIAPKSFATASKLLAKGANQELIIQNLYRTRSVETLRLKADQQIKLVWTILSQQDFLHAGCGEEHLPGLIDELISSSPDTKIILLIYENRQHNVCTILCTERPESAIRLMQNFSSTQTTTKQISSGTHEETHLRFAEQTLPQAEISLLAHIRSVLNKK